MAINDTEQEILQQLQDMETGEVDERKPAEEVLEEAQEPEQEDVVEDEEIEEDGDEIEEEVEEEEPEEELTGAKFRHKLKAEKEARKLVESQLQEMRERMARVEGYQDAQPKKEEPKEVVPDPDIEPERYAVWKAQKLEQKLEEMETANARISAERMWDQIDSQHIQSNETYRGAKEFLIEQEKTEYRNKNPRATEAEIMAHVKQEEYALIGALASRGQDPVEWIEFQAYKQGFRADTSAKESPKKKGKPNLKNIKKNTRKNTSLMGGSNAESNGRMSAESLLSMSMPEIEKMGMDKYEAEIKRIEARELQR